MRRSSFLSLLPLVMSVVITAEVGGSAATAAPAADGAPPATKGDTRGEIRGEALAASAQSNERPATRSDSAPRTDVVVRVGSTTLEVERLRRVFGRLRDLQRKRYGATTKAQLRSYVEQVAVRDLLLAERGRQQGLLESPRVKAQYQLVIEEALIDQLRRRLEHEAPVNDSDAKAYFDAHPELFRAPERIRILRLLVETEAEAVTLLERVNHLPTMDDWRKLVREKSKDKATRERGGDLGFVAADGTTDVPELEVDAGLFAAAKAVRDGEVVKRPVPEGKRFAVVWRRGSLAARSMDFQTEAARIRRQLANDRLDKALQELVAKLRQERLQDVHAELLLSHDFPLPDEPAPEPVRPAQTTSDASVAHH